MTTLIGYKTSDVERREWDFAALLGKPYVAIFGNRVTADDVTAILNALQRDRATADLGIVQVAHVSGLPKALQRLATRSLRKARDRQIGERAAFRARLGLSNDNGDGLLFALDWQGTLTDAFGFTHTQKDVLTLLVDSDGSVVRRIDGPYAFAEIREWATTLAPSLT